MSTAPGPGDAALAPTASDVALHARLADILAAAAAEAVDTAGYGVVESMLQEIRGAADVGGLGAGRAAAEQQAVAARRSWELASKVLRKLEELAAGQAAAEAAGSVESAAETQLAGEDPVAAAQAWAKLFAGRLAEGDLAACDRLASAPLPFAERLPLVAELIREGVAALRGEDWSGAALRLLRLLSGAFTEAPPHTTEERHAYAAVLVLIGRVEFVHRDDADAALRRYRTARDIAPDSALPLAARAAYHHRRREYGAGLAKAQRAVELAPRSPEGYVALGLCAEGQGAPQAKRFYDQAIERVWRRDDPHAALRTFFGPVSRTLMMRLAKRADREKRPDLALRALDDAAALDPPDEANEARWEREASELDLRARALAALERTDDAVSALCDAADRCSWIDKLAAARAHAERALALDADSPRAHWLLADCLRLSSSQVEPPYVSNEPLEESVRHWELAAEAHEAALYSWPLWVRALIEEQRSRLPPADSRHERLWLAVLHLERGLVLDPGDAWAYSSLSRILRGLNCVAAARQAVERALMEEPGDATALEERLILLTGLGSVAEMQEAMESAAPSLWLDAVRAFVLSRANEPEPALELLDEVARQSTELEIWQHEVRAYCLGLMGRHDEEQEEWRRILDRRERASTSDLLSYGWAAWNLGETDTALEIAEELRDDPIDERPAARLAGLCALEQGRLDAARADLQSGVAGSAWAGAVREFRDHDLARVRSRISSPAAETLCDEAAGWASARLEELDRRTAEDDFAIADALEPPEEAAVGWLASQAALARLATEDERAPEAARRYSSLEAFPAEFPEAGVGRDDAVRMLQDRGDAELANGDPATAAQTYGDALALLGDSGYEARAFMLNARLSVAHAELGDISAAGDHLEAATALAGADGAVVGDAGRQLVRDIEQYWAVAGAWQAVRDKMSGGHAALVTDALERLGTYVEDASQGAVEAVRRWPFATPVKVDLADDLVPEDTSEEGWPLISQSIPQMQRRIERDTGLRAPGPVLSSGAWFADGEYVIWLDDAFATRGQVPAGVLYCLQSPEAVEEAGIDAAAIMAADDPLLAPACWVQEGAATAPGAPRLSALHSRTEFIVRRLEATLRNNLSAYLGLQHVEDLLEGERGGRELLFRALTALPDDNARLRFSRVLRELAREQVPIGVHLHDGEYVADLRDLVSIPLESILEAPTVQRAVAAMRAEIKPRLPGNDPRFRRVRVPDAWTAGAVRDGDGRVEWPRSPDDALEHLAAVRRTVKASDRPVALVTPDADLRPRVRAMIAVEFPDVPVLATDELLDPSESLDGLVDPISNGGGGELRGLR